MLAKLNAILSSIRLGHVGRALIIWSVEFSGDVAYHFNDVVKGDERVFDEDWHDIVKGVQVVVSNVDVHV